MPNPARPQYQDIIESTWGQAVADTVIRRFTTAAARDADLAAFTPAQLLGQVCTVGPNLQVHNGTSWGPPGRIARLLGTGAETILTATIPAWAASVRVDWQAKTTTGAAVPAYMQVVVNNDAVGAKLCSYTLQQMGAVALTSANPSSDYWPVGTVRGDYSVGGRIDLPQLTSGAALKVCIGHSEDNNSGNAGGDGNVRTALFTGHRFGAGPITTLGFRAPAGFWAAGSVFDVFATAQ